MRLRSTICKDRGTAGVFTGRREIHAAVLDAESPFLVEFFMVEGRGFKCMAYRNQDGKWRAAFSNEELPAVHILE
jgi:hypothetical protein